jgi:hypothetical protein
VGSFEEETITRERIVARMERVRGIGDLLPVGEGAYFFVVSAEPISGHCLAELETLTGITSARDLWNSLR